MHGRPLVHWHEAFLGWWTLAQSNVRPDCIVVTAPFFVQDWSLAPRGEHLTVEQLVSEQGVEALAVAVLPQRSMRHERRFSAHRCDPDLHLLGDKFGAIVRPDTFWWAAQDEQIEVPLVF